MKPNINDHQQQERLQYGCESHFLSWWLEQDLEALCKVHGHRPEHVAFVLIAVNSAKVLEGQSSNKDF